jgi:beta-lactamase regulating signal transducer with metallopeptidase domain
MTDDTRWWAELLGHWGLAWGVVVILVSVWLFLARPRRSSVRYAGWVLATFAGLILFPLVICLAPKLSWRDAWALFPHGSARTASPGGAEPFHSWFENMTGFPAPLSITASRPEAPVVATSPATPRLDSSAPSEAKLPARPIRGRGMLLALAIWLTGAALFLIRLARAAGLVRALLAASTPHVSERVLEYGELTRGMLSVRRQVRIRLHSQISAPMCVGPVRPVILWPSEANCPMTARKERAALVHELAHLKNGDDWIALLGELWRALVWFFPPVHWALSRVRLEAECRCDDLAAGELSDPKLYARWLLDLAPVRLGVPLASSLSSGSDLARRVRRILRGETGWSHPLGCPQRAALVVLAVVLLGAAGSVRLIGLVRADVGSDAPLPEITPKELAARLRAACEGYDRGLLEVTCESTDNWMYVPGARDSTPVLHQKPGRARFLGDGQRWRIEYDSMLPPARAKRNEFNQWSTGFDGNRLYHSNVDQNEVTFGAIPWYAEYFKPQRLLWPHHWSGSGSLADTLENPQRGQTFAIGQRTVNGVRCYVVEHAIPRWRIKNEILVSPKQGYLPVGAVYFRTGRLYDTLAMEGVRRVGPGRWAPKRIVEECRTVRRHDGVEQFSQTVLHIERFEPEKNFASDAFVFDAPYGVNVYDQREGTSYHNDPWWPEAAKLLRERFDWSKVDLSPLKTLDLPPAFQGVLTPISALTWINSEPIELARLQGKVVLLVFLDVVNPAWSPRCRDSVPALRALYETYHPLGLEMIWVQEDRSDIEAVRRFAREYQIECPIAIEMASGRGDGATSRAYGVEAKPSAVLIDAQGNAQAGGEMKSRGNGLLIRKLIPLLEKAGVNNVPALSLDPIEFSPEMHSDLHDALAKWIKSAPKGLRSAAGLSTTTAERWPVHTSRALST